MRRCAVDGGLTCAGGSNRMQLKTAAATSSQALAKLLGKWLQSFAADARIYRVCYAEAMMQSTIVRGSSAFRQARSARCMQSSIP